MFLAEWHYCIFNPALEETYCTFCTSTLCTSISSNSGNPGFHGFRFSRSIVWLPFSCNDGLECWEATHTIFGAGRPVDVTINCSYANVLVIFQQLAQLLELRFQSAAVPTPRGVEDNHPYSSWLCIRPVIWTEIHHWCSIAATTFLWTPSGGFHKHGQPCSGCDDTPPHPNVQTNRG